MPFLQVERTTNHDVKAIEYVLKDRFAANEELAKVRKLIPQGLCYDDEQSGRIFNQIFSINHAQDPSFAIRFWCQSEFRPSRDGG